jgi:ribonuclease VapC
LIVDTSALVAVVYHEQGAEEFIAALSRESTNAHLLAPVLVELHRVVSVTGNRPNPNALAIVKWLEEEGAQFVSFSNTMAVEAVSANERFGSGNGKGGKLNLLDLMVYAAAKTLDVPILCTGKDFVRTDAKIHPASRIE